jgi:hypothetical protein
MHKGLCLDFFERRSLMMDACILVFFQKWLTETNLEMSHNKISSNNKHEGDPHFGHPPDVLR